MKKKSIVILCSVAAVCAIGLITSHFVDWSVNHDEADGDIGKAARFSQEQVSEKLSNMEELLQTDSAFKDGIVAAQVVMQTRAAQFGTLCKWPGLCQCSWRGYHFLPLMIIDYDIHQLTPYINWDYFFYAWGMHNKPLNARQRELAGFSLRE